ncbi:MAG: hypothetical protein U5K79_07775 [Cyclobacteriaceae bacterium]|nr:hypothetical protein [Cyclobacteriaceae bacterium]
MFPLLGGRGVTIRWSFSQIWLNLPKARKLVEPYFQMILERTNPLATIVDAKGKKTTVKVLAGALDDHKGIALA